MSRRYTMQKQLIGEALMKLDHPTAADVYKHIQEIYPQISLGTVYRNLNQLEEEGDVLRLTFSGEPDRFDPNCHEHYHVACSLCKRIFDTEYDLFTDLIVQLDDIVRSCTGVKVEKRTLLFNGICEKCQLTGKH